MHYFIRKGVKIMAEIKNAVSQKEETKSKVEIPEILTLLKAGSHFGHKKGAWNPKMKRYIYEERNGIHIIDLVKTQELLEQTLKALDEYSQKGNILIVGTKGQAASAVQKMAEESGAFYINKRWPGGLFTNFNTIKRSLHELVSMEENLARGGEGLVKKEILMMERDVERLNKIYKGIKFMEELPSAIIVEKNAIKEAIIAKVPIISLVDTNCDPDVVDYPIPANDDSIKSISLFVELFGKVIKGSKKADAIVSLRRSHEAQLVSLSQAYAMEKERLGRMENEERARLKALREGKLESASTASVVRVVKKVVDVNADIEAAEKVKEESKNILDLGLATRTVNALKDAGIETVKDLMGKTAEDLTKVKGVGEKAAEEILKAIK
jgi:small subunit ribosomal protein S2